MTLKTLADVRTLIGKHLPADTREKSTWRHVATLLAGASRGMEVAREVSLALQLVLQLKGVECRPK
jgi:hypothetical protein